MNHHHQWRDLRDNGDGTVDQYCLVCGEERTIRRDDGPTPIGDPPQEDGHGG